jgi:L-lactate dehydrogenase complex protein LldG
MVGKARKGNAGMNGAREEVLRRVRAALRGSHDSPASEYESIERKYMGSGILDLPSLVTLFVERLRDYGAVVHRCSENSIHGAICRVMESRRKRGLIVPPGVPPVWLPENFAFVPDEGLSYETLDQSEGVLTGCAVAIAATGTIVLCHPAAAGRRALSLVPDYHLCVVYEDQLVETVPEGMRKLRPYQSDPITTISGPSATSDIEMTRVKGVHGPRVLDVVLVAR